MITANGLTEGDSDESMVISHRDGIPETVGRQRDVVKTHDGQLDLVIYGIENQKNVHLAMPVRSADGLDFKNADNRSFFSVAKYLYEKGKNFNVKDFDAAFPDMRLGHDTATAIAAATGSMILLDDMKGKTEKEEIVMCKALEALVQRGEEQGMEKGMEKGMENLNQLYGYLLRNDMRDELERSIADSGYYKELMRKYHDQLVVADGTVVYQ